MLKYHHISQATHEILEYIDDRRAGNIKSLKTRWEKFNNQCMGGIEPNTIYTIAGVSGSGKSSFLNSLENDLFDCNPDAEFVVLSFNFEINKKFSFNYETFSFYTSITVKHCKILCGKKKEIILK